MLSQTGIYALRAMGYLATQRQEEPILTQTIAEKTGIPKNFLSKKPLNSGSPMDTGFTRIKGIPSVFQR